MKEITILPLETTNIKDSLVQWMMDRKYYTIKQKDYVIKEFVEEKKFDALEVSKILDDILVFNSNDAVYDLRPNKNIGIFFENEEALKGFIPKRMADEIKKKFIFKTLRDTEEIFVFEDGIYKPSAKSIIRTEVRKLLGEKSKNYHVGEVVSFITDTTYIDRDEIEPDNKIPLANGMLDLATLELKSFSPNYFFTYKNPIEFDKEATCPKFLEWLKNRLETNGNEEHIWKTNIIQEMFGYALLRSVKFQKAFLFEGQRRTGKSTLLDILIEMVGKKNIGSSSLQFLTEDKFAIAYIHNKALNVFADLSERALRETAMFMMLTGGDSITSAKKRGHAFSFKPITKLVFSCNRIPRTPNKNLAFYRRWIIIKFKNVIPEDDVDVDMKAKLLEELSGILNWSIEGLKRLLENNKFSYPFTEDDVKEMYERGSDSINTFINNMIVEDDNTSITKREVYNSYKEFCKTEELKKENQIKFGRLFKAITGCGTTKISNIPAYAGVRLKDYEPRTLLDY